jgi:putative spermidine/putrescine transport system substrate-binding protein
MDKSIRGITRTTMVVIAIAIIVVVGIVGYFVYALTTQRAPLETVTLGTFAGPYEDYVRNITQRFEKLNPGIEVRVITVNKDTEYLSKLRVWAGRPQVDVMYVAESVLIRGVAEGLLAPINIENIPNAADLYSIAVKKIDGKVYGLAYDFAAWGIVYNEEKLTTAPTKFRDFWDPKFGKVGLEGWPEWDFYATALAWNLDVKTQLDQIIAKLKELKDQGRVFFYNSYQECATAMGQGEVMYAGIWDGRAYTFQKQGLPVKFVYPEEGALAWIGYLVMANGTRHTSAAEKLINYILSPEAQLSFTEAIRYGPTNKKVVLPPELANAVVYGEERVSKLVPMDHAYIAQNLDIWYKRFNEEVLAG